jgi:hypothetical protein
MTMAASVDTQRSKDDDFESQSLLLGEGTGRQKSIQPWRRLIVPTLIGSHILLGVFGYGLGTLSAGYADEPISPWMSSIDRSYHSASFNAFESPNNFTMPSADGGDGIEDHWIETGAYGVLAKATSGN